eukprot:CAMPEP_0185788098 /NCGR_PEP_ID=MMETSP1174-20130828/144258_1 /TAXON_ID=35687 /ORGANISM="Dictyocha speculum, Strain CCMP1381" /LENGTH=64 /DNA_ID=CAMNT_0028481591 /DNA_START=175 /DNA_END=366 /DNA_ORIENTATION=-
MMSSGFEELDAMFGILFACLRLHVCLPVSRRKTVLGGPLSVAFARVRWMMSNISPGACLSNEFV